MDQNLKRSLLIDNFQNPKNKGLIDDKSYIKINTNNESCIDELDIMIKIENNVIQDMRFDGEACAISTGTASVMIKTLIGKTVNEALNIINNYQNMIDEKEYDETILEEAIIYDEIYKQPNRKKCALLPWNGIKEVLEKYI